MRWLFALVLLPLCGCSKGKEADLPAIGEARSLGAEWALVNQQAGEGHLTAAYVATMRRELRDELRSTKHSLKQPASDYGREIDALLSKPDDAPQQSLLVHVARLKKIEKSLESA